MSWSATYQQKCCATCANWSGPREINSTRDQVITLASNQKAKCYLHPCKGGFADGPSADWCCNSDWTKWSALK